MPLFNRHYVMRTKVYTLPKQIMILCPSLISNTNRTRTHFLVLFICDC